MEDEERGLDGGAGNAETAPAYKPPNSERIET